MCRLFMVEKYNYVSLDHMDSNDIFNLYNRNLKVINAFFVKNAKSQTKKIS